MKFVGDKNFYKRVMTVTLPMIIQNGISNFVNLLDNIMVGQTGTEQMSGVSIANQIFFVYMLCIFGATSGAGIFGAQYYGKNDHEGVRYTFRFKLIICAIMLTIGTTVIYVFGPDFINLFLLGEAGTSDPVATLNYGVGYSKIILYGLLPFTLASCYAGTLRECGETYHPMVASLMAVFINLVLNYLLIFGKFGFPELGVNGAAIATTISRFVECIYLVIWTARHSSRMQFIKKAFRSLYLPWKLAKDIIRKGLPLMVNELLFSLGMTTMNQLYSIRGLAVVAAMNIMSVAANLFRVIFMSLGNAVAIMVGQLLGAGKMDEAEDTAHKLIAFSVFAGLVVSGLMVLTAPIFPKLYNTTEEIRHLAMVLLMLLAIFMPIDAFCNACYFTIRSGGKTLITFIFDSMALWVVCIPVAFVIGHYTDLPITWMFICVNGAKIVKIFIGTYLLKKGTWKHNIVNDK
ncbi:MAG: MATE family efflux transporter [Lachnospiraceae bacterium]|nr:MATE family efflux transporter [Lachnospiraceae bacterium]